MLRSSGKEILHQNNSNLELLFQVHFLPKSAVSLSAGAGRCLVSSPIPFLAGHSLPGHSARPGWCQGQHSTGAGGGGAAALEATGAGAEEDGVRPAQDAELGPAGLCHIRTPTAVLERNLQLSLIHRFQREQQPQRIPWSCPLPFPCLSPARPHWPLGYWLPRGAQPDTRLHQPTPSRDRGWEQSTGSWLSLLG